MTRLIELARVLRSKNAGPLCLTFDVMFDTYEQLDYVMRSGALTPEAVAALYGTAPEDVSILRYDIVNSVKITIPRAFPSGSVFDTDIYGCQQHIPLGNLDVPEPEADL